MTNQETITRQGLRAVNLWLKGKDEWILWVEKAPIASVSFEGVDFSKHINHKGNISFQGYKFPKGDVSFRGAKFGEGDVNFRQAEFKYGVVNFSQAEFKYGVVNFNEATFGKGNVDFSGASFGEGDVDFSQAEFEKGDVSFNEAYVIKGNVSFNCANFGEGDVSFNETNFGEGDVSFYGAKFGEGDASFTETNFGEGYVDFSQAEFKKGYVDFNGAKFGEGDVDFSQAEFEKGDVNFGGASFGGGVVDFSRAEFKKGNVFFNWANFGEGDVDFSLAEFKKGDVDFSGASFGGGDVDFSEAKFGEGEVRFEHFIFHGNADFSDLRGCDAVNLFSFKNVSFEKTFVISGDFGCVVDMVGTKTSHHMELSGLKCHLQRKCLWGFFKKSNDKKDAARLRRLKELAEKNKHHEAALRFHANEMRAKRWHETGLIASCQDMIFSGISDYGQSIWRPVAGLVLLTFFFPFVADTSLKFWEFMSLPIEKEMVKEALRNSLPFLPASRSILSSITSILHQLVAIIFIFLIGLGLRNRFRV